MTLDKIKEVAIKHFAKNGYEGASMSQIAEDVGIKKQSIYTYFKGKDELFLQVCNDTFNSELELINSFIETNADQPIDELLYAFLLHYKERYEKDDNTKFWLRVSFFPPLHLQDEILKSVNEYLDKLEELIIPIIDKAKMEEKISSTIDVKKATTAFLGVLDGIFVEMIYGGPERLARRLEASWYLYWRGLAKD